MGKYNFEGLEDKDIFACWLLSQDESGKTDEIAFVKNLDQRREQVKQETIQLSQELEKLEAVNKISNEDFYRQVEIYLLSNQENISMTEAAELFVKLEQERDKMPEGDYGKIVKSMRLPRYSTTGEEPQREKPQKEDAEYVVALDEKGERVRMKISEVESQKREVEWATNVGIIDGHDKLELLKKRLKEVK